MTPDEEIRALLSNISSKAKEWSHSRYMSALIDTATELQGQELREFIEFLVQLSFDEAVGRFPQ